MTQSEKIIYYVDLVKQEVQIGSEVENFYEAGIDGVSDPEEIEEILRNLHETFEEVEVESGLREQLREVIVKFI